MTGLDLVAHSHGAVKEDCEDRSVFRDLRLIPLGEMFARFGVEKSAGYELVAAGLLPSPLPHNGRFSRVPLHECQSVLAAKLRGDSDDEIQKLVRELRAARSRGIAAIAGVIRGAVAPKVAAPSDERVPAKVSADITARRQSYRRGG